jgi:hypothetical protein
MKKLIQTLFIATFLFVSIIGPIGICAAAVTSENAVAITAGEATSSQIQPEQGVKPVPNAPIYTGIIIDAKGLGLQRAMSPCIYDENNNIIYGDKDLDLAFITQNGMVDYNAGARAGANPLIIKAIALKNFNSSPVISNGDANKILVANAQNHFLAKSAVVFEE